MKLFTLLFSICLTFGSIAQQIEVTGNPIEVEPYQKNYRYENSDRTNNCQDTILYLDTKVTSTSGILLNNSSSAHAFAQFFDCPAPVTIHGVQFIAHKTDNTNGDSIDVSAFVYDSSNDSIPQGGYKTSGITTISNNNFGYNVNLLTKTIMFDSAVTMTDDFLITVMNNSATDVTLYTSDYNAGDGQGEYLGSARIGFNWVRGYNIDVGGVPYDADMIFRPIVSYELDAAFDHSPNCNPDASTDNFTNLSTALLYNRFYSQAAFNGEDSLQFSWSFGDGSPGVNALNPVHNYPAGNYLIGMTATMFGWTNNCGDSDAQPTCYQPASTEELDVTSNLRLFPNPAASFVSIESNKTMKQLEVYSVNGKLVMSRQINGQQAVINTEELSNGIYILQTTTVEGDRLIEKLHIFK